MSGDRDTEAGQRLSLIWDRAWPPPEALGSRFICSEPFTPGKQRMSYLVEDADSGMHSRLSGTGCLVWRPDQKL